MIHYGDISEINGRTLFPVDCITFGSPCQDLSISGRRAGLSGQRSGLFMEAIRIIKEMREATYGLYPRFAVWENVPGAFSSNSGEDFRTVLEELIHIRQGKAYVPASPEGGWRHAGFIGGSGWSLAWRLFDAQYWGVPQRRRRIALVMDFGGQCAGEILFERKSLQRHKEPRIPPWESSAKDPAHSVGQHDKMAGQPAGFNGWKSVTGSIQFNTDQCPTTEYNMPPYVLCQLNDQGDATDLVVIENHIMDARYTLSGDKCGTVVARYGTGGLNTPLVLEKHRQPAWIVRRLTPLECERLQGFPDGWTDIGDWIDSHGKKRKCTDSLRYKALGNSIALPQWWWLVNKMKTYLPFRATLGSLFAGIGGFDLVWEKCYGKGTSRWTSEIEDFCNAVLKERF